MKQTPRDKHGNPTDCTMTRIRRDTLRKMHLIAAFKNITIVEYLDHLMATQGSKDFHTMADEMSKMKI